MTVIVQIKKSPPGVGLFGWYLMSHTCHQGPRFTEHEEAAMRFDTFQAAQEFVNQECSTAPPLAHTFGLYLKQKGEQHG